MNTRGGVQRSLFTCPSLYSFANFGTTDLQAYDKGLIPPLTGNNVPVRGKYPVRPVGKYYLLRVDDDRSSLWTVRVAERVFLLDSTLLCKNARPIFKVVFSPGRGWWGGSI